MLCNFPSIFIFSHRAAPYSFVSHLVLPYFGVKCLFVFLNFFLDMKLWNWGWQQAGCQAGKKKNVKSLWVLNKINNTPVASTSRRFSREMEPNESCRPCSPHRAAASRPHAFTSTLLGNNFHSSHLLPNFLQIKFSADDAGWTNKRTVKNPV